MIGVGVVAGTRRRSVAASAPFAGIGSLFAGGQKGAYYDFADRTKLAVNDDGSGGSPSVGGAARWAVDQSPNGNHLRNTTGSSVAVASNGIATSGAGLGLYNAPGHGGWPQVDPPFVLVATFEQLAYAGDDRRIVDMSATFLLQGPTDGTVRTHSTASYGVEVNARIGEEVTVEAVFNGSASSIALDGGPPTTFNLPVQAGYQMLLGSDAGGNNAASVRFKRLFIREGVLSATDRAGVIAWARA